MADTILQTKLYVPQTRPSLVPRPHLVEKLNQGLAGKLTLVSAPAGSGKTTLIADWGRRLAKTGASSPAVPSKPQLCWLSLDTYDDDPNRFWQYVLAALDTAIPHISASSRPLLQTSPLPAPPALLAGLLNNLAAHPYPLVLVLDDYHLIGSSLIHEGIAYLIEHAPPPFHQVLITRADPPLPLPRLRARSLLNEIRAADLSFSEAEAAVFLRQVMGLSLSTHDVAALEARTEGWITGLHLAAVSLQNQAEPAQFIKNFTGSHHYILEYLAEEVLRQQTEAVQTFLMHTSILPRLSSALCDAVAERNDSQAILDQLSRQNLFITPLDDSHQWYRTHHLLADLLNNRLRQVAPREQIRELHQRASRWFEEEEDWEAAVSHAIMAADWERAADLVSRAHASLTSQGRIATWQHWLAQVPPALVRSRPELHIRQGWAAFLNGQLPEAEITLQAARQNLLASPVSTQSQALRGELASYLATIAFFHERPAAVIQAAEEALAFLPPEAVTSRVRATIALGLGASLAGDSRQGMYQYQQAAELARTADHVFLLAHALETVADGHLHLGQLQAAERTCRQIIELGKPDQSTTLPFTGNGYIKLAAVEIERRQLVQAREHLEEGIALSQQGGIGYSRFEALCLLARLQQITGDNAGALAVLSQAESIYQQSKSTIMGLQLAAYQVQYWLSVADLARAASWAENHPLTGEQIRLNDLPIIGQEVQQVSQACVYLAQGNHDAVLALYNQIADQAESAGRISRVIEISLLRALALQAKGDTTGALATLRRILVLARPEQYVQIFVGAGQDMQTLLTQLPGGEQDDYVRLLLSAFPQPAPSEPFPIASALVEPLSRREMEVLRLIAAGFSNKQIAAQLTVTLNTVKKHSSHIYGKLGVDGRTQAIIRARELNLL